MSGRPTKLTCKLREQICVFISQGHPYKRACLLCGISTTIFCNWRNEGEIDKKNGKKSIYVEFIESVEQAGEKFIAFHIENINKAGRDGDWRASMELLSRKYPKEFAKKDYMAVRSMSEEEAAMTFADIVRKEITDKTNE